MVAANIIHHIHYMGRQVGKAKIIADKMLSVSAYKQNLRILQVTFPLACRSTASIT